MQMPEFGFYWSIYPDFSLPLIEKTKRPRDVACGSRRSASHILVLRT